MSDKKVQMKVYVSAEARKTVNRVSNFNDESNGEYVERLIWEDQGGEEASVLKSRVEHKRSQLQAAIDARDNEQDNVDELHEEIERLQSQIEELEQSSDEYKAEIQSLESIIESGERIFQNCSRIRELSDEYEKPADQVYRDVKEMHSEYPNAAFRLAKPSEPTDWKESVEQQGN